MAYFIDYFNVNESDFENYGGFNISLICDLPLFIDPFLLYSSKKKEYLELHNGILEYLAFLKRKSEQGNITNAKIMSWYKFPEVKQNWFGYSLSGNGGSGLGMKFGKIMSSNMHIVYSDLNNERITTTSHIEKVGLFQLGVGRDNISDFSCNLIKSFLLNYTQTFALKYLKKEQVKNVKVNKVYFDYELEKWCPQTFTLPYYIKDYIILTPKDILTKDENWINSYDLKGNFLEICSSIPNEQLRSEINDFYRKHLPAPVIIGKGNNQRMKEPSKKEKGVAINDTIRQYPEVLNYYIKSKEEDKEGAINLSKENVDKVEALFKDNIKVLVDLLKQTDFYSISPRSSYDEAMNRVLFVKDVIENKDGYRIFYHKGIPIKKEADLQIIYRFTWFESPMDVNREVNNGRGPVDYSISKGSNNKSLVEFKLASSSKLKMNLKNQVEIYQKASNTNKSIIVILYFNSVELLKVNKTLNDLNLNGSKDIILIDAGDNKPSASNAK